MIGVARHAPQEKAIFSKFYSVDIRDTEAMTDIIRTLGADYPLQAVINNAAYSPIVDFLEADLSTFDDAFAINVRSMFALTQSAAHVLIANGGGSIINLSSVHAHQGSRGMSIYAATKGAIEAFTRTIAAELAQHNIRCNSIAPSATSTPRLVDSLSSSQVGQRTERIPLGRLASSKEIAAVIAFLISDEARFITGVTVPVDGGYLAVKNI